MTWGCAPFFFDARPACQQAPQVTGRQRLFVMRPGTWLRGQKTDLVVRAVPNDVSYRAAISASEIGCLLPMSLSLVLEMAKLRLTPAVLAHSSAISVARSVNRADARWLSSQDEAVAWTFL
ncbi:unnamed protein product [Polarella glacialis]|uniref:Uncharacterized protein n=1 Tax=Polarella glacialis TaxID=89957 RepID=A0A813KKU9_POLGL|nr:unnamed protein product [Polarella glacialis]